MHVYMCICACGQIFTVLTTYVFPDKIDFLFAFYHRYVPIYW